MIAFRCASCQMQFNLKDEFAGRSTRCPACKQPLTVPSLDKTQAYVPPQHIDGEESCLAKIGQDGGVTLEHHSAGGQQTTAYKPPRSVREALAGRHKCKERYVIEGEIARGGMGAVLRAIDGDLRREIAVKYLLDEKDPRKKIRFVEEAQINAQLEHPNIVPVYDLRIDPQGRPYLVMKLVKGRDLKSVLDQLRSDPEHAEKEWSLGRLLNILVNVCNGLAFAHANGVIHRDLKPGNLMLGDFGEVYVMDWGLAKVLKREAAAQPATHAEAFASFMGESGAASVQQSSRVAISRELEADLTQEGDIMGTPMYMPPEQAIGNVQGIDQRSDVYALGAILYEMLTLQPPIDKHGGYRAVLVRVASGEITVPEQRDLQRAKAGKIPRELAAIAMKALAKEPEQRYPTVGEMRKDIERFQEGRSVSAKTDSVKELAWKLAKRNKGVSLATAAALVVLATVLAVSFQFINDARIKANSQRARAEQALGAFKQEQKDKQERTRHAIPALVAAARQVANAGNFKDAKKQVDLALLYEPKNADAHLLRGQLLLGQKDWTTARGELEQYLEKKPNDADARELLSLCSAEKVNDAAAQFAVAEVLARQNMPGPAMPLLQQVAGERTKRETLLPLYRQQIEASWKGLGGRLSLAANAQFSLDFNNCRQVTSLEPLKGMQLNSLTLANSQVSDLTPLKGMPLTSLALLTCRQVRDFTPLQDLPLTTLKLDYCDQLRDLTPLKGIPLTQLIIMHCFQVQDLTPLHGMPLSSLSVGDLGLVNDLTPLKGMPLTSLALPNCVQVHDLTPLKGMRLTSLSLWLCGRVQDLTPLKGMPLTFLDIALCPQLRDVTPLQGMSLTEISLTPTSISNGMDVLRRMQSLDKINSLPPATFWKKYDAGEFK